MIFRILTIATASVALFGSNYASAALPDIPVNRELDVARHNYTGFHTSSTHMNFEHHIDFLEHQTKALWPTVSKELENIGIPELIRLRDEARKAEPTLQPYTVVDLGGAAGSLAALVLEKYPTTQAICIDIEHKFLTGGAKLFENHVPANRLRFLHASSSETTLPSESVDLVLSQFVFQHLYNITGTMDEVTRIMAPGATLLVIDADMHLRDLVFPMPPTMRLANRLHMLHQQKNVAGLESGILLQFLRDSMSVWGLQDVKEHVAMTDSQKEGTEHYWPLLAPTQYYALVRNGEMKKKEFDSAVAEFNAWRMHVKDVFFMKCIVALWSGRKPTVYQDAKGQPLPASEHHTLTVARAHANPPPALAEFERRIAFGLAHAARRRAIEGRAMEGRPELSDDELMRGVEGLMDAPIGGVGDAAPEDEEHLSEALRSLLEPSDDDFDDDDDDGDESVDARARVVEEGKLGTPIVASANGMKDEL